MASTHFGGSGWHPGLKSGAAIVSAKRTKSPAKRRGCRYASPRPSWLSSARLCTFMAEMQRGPTHWQSAAGGLLAGSN